MRTKPLAGLTIRTALLLGFGLTLGLWLFAGVQLTRRMAEVEQQAAAINERYMRAQELIANVRPQVLLASVWVRDALLDPGLIDESRRQVLNTFDAVDAALKRYVPVFDSAAERQRVARLRDEITGFRDSMVSVLDGDNSR